MRTNAPSKISVPQFKMVSAWAGYLALLDADGAGRLTEPKRVCHAWVANRGSWHDWTQILAPRRLTKQTIVLGGPPELKDDTYRSWQALTSCCR